MNLFDGRNPRNSTTKEKTMNQIKGYRDLSKAEIDLINRIKEHAESVRSLVVDLKTAEALLGGIEPDPRWLAIGVTHLQEGFMALTRAIAKPESF